MEYNNPVDKNGLIQAVERNLFGDAPFGKISGNADRMAIFTGLFNDAMSRYALIALTSDTSWQFDDNNYTDFPIGTTDLIANQPDYTLNTSQVMIEQVEVMDPTGTIWMPVPEMDERKFAEYQVSESQYNNNISGVPRQHVKKGNSIYLFPTPIYSITQVVNGTGGLRVRFKRPPNYFVVTDTTKLPGFNRMHQDYLADWVTWKYASMRGMPIATTFGSLVVNWEQVTIPQSYGSRSLESPRSMQAFKRSSR